MTSFQTFPQPWFLSSSAKQNFESICWDSFQVAGCVQQQQHLQEEGRDCSSSSASCWSTSLWSPVSSSGPHTRSASPSNHPRHSHCRLSSPSSTFTLVCSILKLNPSENHWKVFTKQFISISRSKSHKMLTYENRADQQQVTRRLQKYSSKLWVNHNPDLCSYILYWSAPLKETLVFQLTLAEAFHDKQFSEQAPWRPDWRTRSSGLEVAGVWHRATAPLWNDAFWNYY